MDQSGTSRTILVTVAMVSLALSGCFGYEEDALRPGTQAIVRFTVLQDGETLLSGTTQAFTLGSGGSGLGAAWEQGLVGKSANGTIETRVEPTQGQGEVHRADALVEREPLDRTFTLDEIARAGFPREQVEVGFVLSGVGLGEQGLEVVAVEGGNATLRFLLRDDDNGRQVDRVEQLGVDVVYSVEGDELVTRLRPIEGALVMLPVVDPLGRPVNPFGVDPGLYRMAGMEEDQILMVQGTLSQVIEDPVTVESQVVDTRAQATPEDGHFGSRISPVVVG